LVSSFVAGFGVVFLKIAPIPVFYGAEKAGRVSDIEHVPAFEP
jgi:hypothetical protein